jgi:hypothetical protein
MIENIILYTKSTEGLFNIFSFLLNINEYQNVVYQITDGLFNFL